MPSPAGAAARIGGPRPVVRNRVTACRRYSIGLAPPFFVDRRREPTNDPALLPHRPLPESTRDWARKSSAAQTAAAFVAILATVLSTIIEPARPSGGWRHKGTYR
jgi:hypothetical protein